MDGMKTIWKYQLEIVDAQVIEMPEGAEILTVQVQHNVPCLWAIVNTNAPKTPHKIYIRGTGHSYTSTKAEYIGTFQVMSGNLVFHVFDEA